MASLFTPLSLERGLSPPSSGRDDRASFVTDNGAPSSPDRRQGHVRPLPGGAGKGRRGRRAACSRLAVPAHGFPPRAGPRLRAPAPLAGRPPAVRRRAGRRQAEVRSGCHSLDREARARSSPLTPLRRNLSPSPAQDGRRGGGRRPRRRRLDAPPLDLRRAEARRARRRQGPRLLRPALVPLLRLRRRPQHAVRGPGADAPAVDRRGRGVLPAGVRRPQLRLVRGARVPGERGLPRRIDQGAAWGEARRQEGGKRRCHGLAVERASSLTHIRRVPPTARHHARPQGFVRNMRAGKLWPDCGSDDHQVNCLVRLPPIVAAFAGSREMLPAVADAIRVTQNDEIAVAWGCAAARGAISVAALVGRPARARRCGGCDAHNVSPVPAKPRSPGGVHPRRVAGNRGPRHRSRPEGACARAGLHVQRLPPAPASCAATRVSSISANRLSLTTTRRRRPGASSRRRSTETSRRRSRTQSRWPTGRTWPRRTSSGETDTCPAHCRRPCIC